MTSWVVGLLRHMETGTLGGSLGGGSFLVKVDINNGNGTSTDENTQHLETSVQIAITKTFFTTSTTSFVQNVDFTKFRRCSS